MELGRLGLEPRTKALKGLRPLDKLLNLYVSIKRSKAGKGVFWGGSVTKVAEAILGPRISSYGAAKASICRPKFSGAHPR
jgi:hypothetical protein